MKKILFIMLLFPGMAWAQSYSPGMVDWIDQQGQLDMQRDAINRQMEAQRQEIQEQLDEQQMQIDEQNIEIEEQKLMEVSNGGT